LRAGLLHGADGVHGRPRRHDVRRPADVGHQLRGLRKHLPDGRPLHGRHVHVPGGRDRLHDDGQGRRRDGVRRSAVERNELRIVRERLHGRGSVQHGHVLGCMRLGARPVRQRVRGPHDGQDQLRILRAGLRRQPGVPQQRMRVPDRDDRLRRSVRRLDHLQRQLRHVRHRLQPRTDLREGDLPVDGLKEPARAPFPCV
jgi:hypothetical protein